jgi:hypothetical protein
MVSALLQTLCLAAGLAAAAFGFAFWSYGRTSPRPSPAALRPLVACRAASLTLAGFILLSPVLEFGRPRDRRPPVALLIDDSGSMAADGARSGRVRRLKDGAGFKSLARERDFSVVLFSDRVRVFGADGADSASFRGPATDLAAAFRRLADQPWEKRPAAVVLVSDGAVNLGGDPAAAAAALGAPVHTLCLGDSNPEPDGRIERVLSAGTVTAETDCPVEISVSGRGYAGRSATVSLFAGERKVDAKTVILPAGGREADVRLSWRPGRPGDCALRAVLSPIPGERNRENNERRWTAQALKAGFRILIVAAGPGPDFAFIRRALESVPDFHVETRTVRSASEFYEGPFFTPAELAGADALFIVGLPGPGPSAAAWRSAAAAVRSSRLPFAWFPGRAADAELGGRTPFSVLSGAGGRPLTAALTAAGASHPAGRLAGGPEANRRAWASLPPVVSVADRADPSPRAAVIAEGVPPDGRTGNEGAVPLITAGRGEGGKCLAVLARDVYRWDLATAGLGGGHDVLAAFLEAATRWLGRPDEARPVQFIDETGAADAGRDFPVAVLVTDAASRPVAGAAVVVTARGPSEPQSRSLEETEPGVFRGSFRPSGAGILRLEVEARLEGATLGRDTLTVSVQPFLPEQADTRARPDLMRAISEATAGTVLRPDDADPLAPAAEMPAERIEVRKRLAFFDMPWLLVPLALLLCFEWLIRRRAGLD